MVLTVVLGVDANARLKFKVVTDDKLIAKLCHMVIHYQWYTSTGILSTVLIVLRVDANARPKFKVVTDDKLIAKLCHIVIQYTSTGILSMVLLCVRVNGTPQQAFQAWFSFVLARC